MPAVRTSDVDPPTPPPAARFGHLVDIWAERDAALPVAVVVSVFDDLLASSGGDYATRPRPLGLDDILIDGAGIAHLAASGSIVAAEVTALLTKALEGGAGEAAIPPSARAFLSRLADDPAMITADNDHLRQQLRGALGTPASRPEMIDCLAILAARPMQTELPAPLPVDGSWAREIPTPELVDDAETERPHRAGTADLDEALITDRPQPVDPPSRAFTDPEPLTESDLSARRGNGVDVIGGASSSADAAIDLAHDTERPGPGDVTSLVADAGLLDVPELVEPEAVVVDAVSAGDADAMQADLQGASVEAKVEPLDADACALVAAAKEPPGGAVEPTMGEAPGDAVDAPPSDADAAKVESRAESAASAKAESAAKAAALAKLESVAKDADSGLPGTSARSKAGHVAAGESGAKAKPSGSGHSAGVEVADAARVLGEVLGDRTEDDAEPIISLRDRKAPESSASGSGSSERQTVIEPAKVMYDEDDGDDRPPSLLPRVRLIPKQRRPLSLPAAPQARLGLSTPVDESSSGITVPGTGAQRLWIILICTSLVAGGVAYALGWI